MQRALDLANAVATHLYAVGPASRQAGSPLGQSTYCSTYASLPSQAPSVTGSALEPACPLLL